MKRFFVLGLLALILMLSVSAAQAGGVIPPTSNTVLASARAATGTIAYVVADDTTGDQIWLIEPDGSNKRKIYGTGKADPYGVQYITSLAWRPDSGELAFASNHEYDCSVFASDVFGIFPNGSGYRRITNGPNCAALANYPQGKVVLSVPGGDWYQVYVAGAPQLKSALGGSVTFDKVADFGADVQQPVVAISGQNRYMMNPVDVPTLNGTSDILSGANSEHGAYRPAWRSDGSKVGYAYGCAALITMAAQPPAGTWGDIGIGASDGVSPCGMVWGPTPTTANQIVYWTNLGDDRIFSMTENDKSSIKKLVSMRWEDVQILDVKYLPNGSGLIYALVDNLAASSNLYRYDFVSGNVTQLTHYTDMFAREFAISPDGQRIVYELAAPADIITWLGPSDLYMAGIDGSDPQPFVAGGAHPSWSLSTPNVPSNPPAPTPGTTPSPTATQPAPGTTPSPSGPPAPVSGTTIKLYLPFLRR